MSLYILNDKMGEFLLHLCKFGVNDQILYYHMDRRATLRLGVGGGGGTVSDSILGGGHRY